MAWTMKEVKARLPHLYLPNKWQFRPVKLPKAKNIGLPSIDWNDYDLRCYTHGIPQPQAQVGDIQVHGFKIKQTQGVDYSVSGLSITFYQGVDFKIERFFWALLNASEHNENGTQTNREDLKFDFDLISLDPTNGMSEIRTIRIIGALVESIETPDLTGDQQAEFAQLTVTISADYHKRGYPAIEE